MTTDQKTSPAQPATPPAFDHVHEDDGHVHGPGCSHGHGHHHHHAPQAPIVRQGPKVGRNDPCPCGSGKKAKKCCGA